MFNTSTYMLEKNLKQYKTLTFPPKPPLSILSLIKGGGGGGG